MKTNTFIGKFKGSDVFQIWEVNENDEKVGERPLIGLGLKKLKLIIKHIDKVKKFIDLKEDKHNEKF